ncbi:phage portal protein [Breoghania sp.]|uniref:phage portal protein n=1 Tax=Breoghania sp. TaxID=2065378 RepID=UPI002AA7329F|nr:phage portal protein [Breoghania sp.]
MVEKPRIRIPAVMGATIPDAAVAVPTMAADAFTASPLSNPRFEAAGRGRRLRGFNPPKDHVNRALQKAGQTLISRARWLYDNDGFAGNAVDEWAVHVVGDGIKPRPQFGSKSQKKKATELFWLWAEECDADGVTDFYGLQEMIARETFLTGECFVRIRPRQPGDMETVPFQLQVLPSEMLDASYNAQVAGGGYIRAGIEFGPIGNRVAYHFWRWHPYDDAPASAQRGTRVRVPADRVLHIFDGKQAGQIRGAPRVARVLVKLFQLEAYDDAELERKKTAALFAGFIKGRGDAPLVEADDGDVEYIDDEIGIAPMEPGAMIDLGVDKDVSFSTPTDVGGSYEAFQYRNLLKICAGLGIPYFVVTGDLARGNFANVRAGMLGFRRRVKQWQHNTMVFQFCRPVWAEFMVRAHLAGALNMYGVQSKWKLCEWMPQAPDWVDPYKDIAAEKVELEAGLRSRTQSLAQRGYDREAVDDEIEQERKDAKGRGLSFSTDGGGSGASRPASLNAPPDGSAVSDGGGSADENTGANDA